MKTKFPELGWLDDTTAELRRKVAAEVPPERVDREVIRVLMLVIQDALALIPPDTTVERELVRIFARVSQNLLARLPPAERKPTRH
jgi:hypothetical protein